MLYKMVTVLNILVIVTMALMLYKILYDNKMIDPMKDYVTDKWAKLKPKGD